MTRQRSLAPALALGALPALLVGAPLAGRFLDGPPPAHTGGFGEPTCAACHFDGPQSDPEGALSVEGLPPHYHPGKTYLLTLALRDPELRRAGFQLSARDPDGRQAGVLEALDPGTAVGSLAGVQYAHQTAAGAEPAAPGAARWRVRWTAPTGTATPVLFHAVGNAADGDDSQFGDRIYADSSAVPPSRSSAAGSR